MGAFNLFTKSFHPLRSHLVADAATKSSFQSLIENALGKTREFLRVFCRKKNEIAADSNRYQYRLPVEYFPKSSDPTVPAKSKFLSYRPGFIGKVTSKWVTDSLVGEVSKDARKVFRGAKKPLLCFVGFGLAKKQSLLKDEEELEGVSFGIRDAFSTIPLETDSEKDSIIQAYNKQFSFSDLKIGDLIAKGCNAAVYSACLANQSGSEIANEEKENTTAKADIDIPSTKVFISHSEGLLNSMTPVVNETVPSSNSAQNFNNFNLAVKVMFNYCAESNSYAIWRAMHKEILPAQAEFCLNETNSHKSRKKKLKPHPNVVQMYFAFADQIPLLPGAFANYPQALPMRLLSDGCGRNMTMFLVMKRYHCSLKEYLTSYDVSAHTALLLFTQLLEALVHLLQNEVVHRDLKTDNILLDLSDGVTSPKLAVTDFGCCLENLHLNYSSPEIEKGGNMALMAPEVVAAEAGPFSVIDYSRADLWTAGTLAYEIFGGSNPFYSTKSSLKNFSYDENTFTSLPSKAPQVLQKLVREMLHVDPHQRPSQTFAATICQVLLLGPPSVPECSCSKDLHQAVLDWMFLMSAETFVESSFQTPESKTVELELRHTFCSRIQYLDVLNAVKYIMDV